MAARTERKSLNDYLGEKAARKAEYAARGEDTPEMLEWLRRGVVKRRRELFGWRCGDA